MIDIRTKFLKEIPEAFQNEDVDAIIKMYAHVNLLDKSDINPEIKIVGKENTEEEEKEELEKDIQSKGLLYSMGSNTEYVSELDHGDHIHVKVKVDNAFSEVVLVQENGILKMHPHPGWFIN